MISFIIIFKERKTQLTLQKLIPIISRNSTVKNHFKTLKLNFYFWPQNSADLTSQNCSEVVF